MVPVTCAVACAHAAVDIIVDTTRAANIPIQIRFIFDSSRDGRDRTKDKAGLLLSRRRPEDKPLEGQWQTGGGPGEGTEAWGKTLCLWGGEGRVRVSRFDKTCYPHPALSRRPLQRER